VKISKLPEWMIAFQSFIYPFLVLLSNPAYFLVIVLASKIMETTIFIRNSKRILVSKVLQVASFCCEIAYHCTFIIFAMTKDEEIIVYNCLACLGFLFLGAILNFILVVIYCAVVIKAIFSMRRSNSVQDSNPIRKK
jgi:hypothetical protein